MTPEEINQIGALLAASEQRITERQERGVEMIVGEIAKCLTHDQAHHRFEGIERRLELVEVNTSGILMQLGALNKSMTALDQSHTTNQATQAAQQRAFDDLMRRVQALEKKAS